CVRGRATLGRCARARAIAPASPARMSRASFLACLRRESRDGRAGSDLGAVIAPSFTNRLYPAEDQAERRCTRTRLGAHRWESSLAGGGGRPVSALPAVSGDCPDGVNRRDVEEARPTWSGPGRSAVGADPPVGDQAAAVLALGTRRTARLT